MLTSGLMVMAMHENAHRKLSQLFEKREVSKVYEAQIWGEVDCDSGRIELPLRCDWPNRPKQIVDHDLGKNAITDWEILSRDGDTTRVVLKPMTGRSHQLRVHMASMGHPILGDDLYAHKQAFNASDRLCLHARDLSFKHPGSGNVVSFHSPVPF